MRILSAGIISLLCITGSALTLVNENHCGISGDQPTVIGQNLILGLFDDSIDTVMECLKDPNVPILSKQAVIATISPAWNLDTINFDQFGLETLRDESSPKNLKLSILKAYALAIDTEKNRISADALYFLENTENNLRQDPIFEEVFSWIDYRLKSNQEMIFGSTSSTVFFGKDRTAKNQDSTLPLLERDMTQTGLMNLALSSNFSDSDAPNLINAFNLAIEQAQTTSSLAKQNNSQQTISNHLINMLILTESVEEWNNAGRVVSDEKWTALFEIYKEFWEIRENIDPELKLDENTAQIAVDLLGFNNTDIKYLDFVDSIVINKKYESVFAEFSKNINTKIYTSEKLAADEYIYYWHQLLSNSYKVNSKSTFPLLVAASFQQDALRIMANKGISSLERIDAQYVFIEQDKVFSTLVENNPFLCIPNKSSSKHPFPDKEWDARKLPCIGWGYIAEVIYNPIFKLAIQGKYDILDLGLSLLVSDYEALRILIKNEDYSNLYRKKDNSELFTRDEFYHGKKNTVLTEIMCEMVVNDDLILKDSLNFFSFKTEPTLNDKATRLYTSRAGSITFLNTVVYELALIDQSTTSTLDNPTRYNDMWLPLMTNGILSVPQDACSEAQIQVAEKRIQDIINDPTFEISDRLSTAFDRDFSRMSQIVQKLPIDLIHQFLTGGDGDIAPYLYPYFFKGSFNVPKEKLINDFERISQ